MTDLRQGTFTWGTLKGMLEGFHDDDLNRPVAVRCHGKVYITDGLIQAISTDEPYEKGDGITVTDELDEGTYVLDAIGEGEPEDPLNEAPE